MSKPTNVGRCPVCGKPRVAEFRPFCSKQCQLIDLGRWFGEDYGVPAVERADDSPRPEDSALDDWRPGDGEPG